MQLIKFIPTIVKIECGQNSDKVRVRTLIRYLTNDLTGIKNALPSQVFNGKYDAVKYPNSVVKNKLYSEFGIGLERFVAYQLYKLNPENFRSSTKTISVFSNLLDSNLKDVVKKFVASDICPDENEYENITTKITTFFKTNFPDCLIFYQTEFAFGKVAGHPDFVVRKENGEIVILDCKVFARMVGGKDNREIKTQLAVYAALARKLGYLCDTVGIISPWKREQIVQLYSIEKWNSECIAEKCQLAAEKVEQWPAHSLKWSLTLDQFNVGAHIQKEMALEFIKNRKIVDRPFQIFLFGNMPSASIEAEGLEEWKKLSFLSPNCFSPYKSYIHAPYNLNLGKSLDYIVNSIVMYLETAQKYGFRGVVFHVGHFENENQGIEQMHTTISTALTKFMSSVQPNKITTKFLLETPCGNKNELLNTPEKFSAFCDVYSGLPFGICFDSCHVFVNGYYPTEYISKMSALSVSNINLIHFNGSRKQIGCKADGHAHVTSVQNIPDCELLSLLRLANDQHIDCVTE